MPSRATKCPNSGAGNKQGVVVALAWVGGAKRFSELTHDVKKRHYIQQLIQNQPHRISKLLLEQTISLQKTKVRERGSLAAKVERVLQTIDNHTVIGDVFVQNQGQPAAFAWSSIRLILRLATADLEANQSLAGCLVDVAEHLEIAEQQLTLFPTDDYLFGAAIELFASALRFLVKTRLFLRENKLARTVGAASGDNVKFKMLFEDIQRRASSMERVFGTATERRSREIKQLNTILDWFRTWLPVDGRSSCDTAESEAGTCQWLASDDEFCAWNSSGCKETLVIEGPEGCGKTVLANHLSRSNDTRLVVLYHCDNATRIDRLVASILSTLMRSIIASPEVAPWHKTVTAEIQDLVEPANRHKPPQAKILQLTLDRIFARGDGPEASIIIDSVNECPAEDKVAFFEYLECLGKPPRVQLIVFSRPDRRLKAKRTVYMKGPRIEAEIKHYVAARASSTEALQSLSSAELDQILQASGTFLTSRLLLDELMGAESLDHRAEILNSTPVKLLDRYDIEWHRLTREPIKGSQCTSCQVFALILPARRSLTVNELSSFISLDSHTNRIHHGRKLVDPSRTIERACGSFVSFAEQKVEISHPSMRGFLWQKLRADSKSPYQDPDAHLAEKCLCTLNEERYTQVPYASGLLRKHLLPPGLLTGTNSLPGNNSPLDDGPLSYEYAALNWQHHVAAVLHPSDSLLARVSDFITGIAAVTYSERLIDIKGGSESASINAQIEVRVVLTQWVQSLPPSSRPKVPIKDYFIRAHELLRLKLDEDAENDRLLPYTPAIRLGQWYSTGATSDSDLREAYKYKRIAFEGATHILGKRSPTTLKWRISWVNSFFPQGLIIEAENELKEVVDIGRDILGSSEDFFRAVQLLGDTQYHLTKFEDAFDSLEESGIGLLHVVGATQWIYHVNNLYQAWVIERQGSLQRAGQMQQAIIDKWGPIGGATNGLTLFAHTSLGSIQRKQQKYQEARGNLQFAYDARKRLFTLNSNTTVDTGIQLSLTLREIGLASAALDLLDALEKSTVFPDDFVRHCQVTYIRSLIAFDNGYFERPKNDLLGLVSETVGDQREKNNRDCLWIRTTLADALRSRENEPEDERESEALMLFAELVEEKETGTMSRPSTPNSLRDEPECREHLVLAEKAVRMVKDCHQAAATDLLERNGLQWVRPKDFWIGQGGPPVDLAWIRAVKFSSLRASGL